MKSWHHQYHDAVTDYSSPEELDQQIVQSARKYKAPRGNRRILSGAASGLATTAILILLAHPAQYLGALTADKENPEGEVIYWEPPAPSKPEVRDEWSDLRDQAASGEYHSLCRFWREFQLGASALDDPPKDLRDKARRHCRALATAR